MPLTDPPVPLTPRLAASIWGSFPVSEAGIALCNALGIPETTVFCTFLNVRCPEFAIRAALRRILESGRLPFFYWDWKAVDTMSASPWFHSQYEHVTSELCYGRLRETGAPFFRCPTLLQQPRHLQILSMELLDVSSCQRQP